MAVVLLVLVYTAQPGFAMLGAPCGDHGCGPVAEGCCCEGTPVVEVQSVPEDDCCGEPDASVPEDASTSECSCRLDSTPLPLPEPALPPGRSDVTGDGSLASWVRMHAELFASLPCGPPVHLPPGAGEAAAGGVASLAADGSSFAHEAKSVGSWALLGRGVAGFLAVLSVARL